MEEVASNSLEPKGPQPPSGAALVASKPGASSHPDDITASEAAAAVCIQRVQRGKAARRKKTPPKQQGPLRNSHLERQLKAREQEERLMRREKLQIGMKRKDIDKETEEAKNALALQSKARGFLNRKAIQESEAALEIHLIVLAKEQAYKLRASEQAKARNEFEEFNKLEALVGKQEQADYFKEIEGRKILIAKQLQEVEKGRFYLSAKEQKRVFREIRMLKEQLASLVHEAQLIRSSTRKSLRAASAAPAPAPAPETPVTAARTFSKFEMSSPGASDVIRAQDPDPGDARRKSDAADAGSENGTDAPVWSFLSVAQKESAASAQSAMSSRVASQSSPAENQDVQCAVRLIPNTDAASVVKASIQISGKSGEATSEAEREKAMAAAAAARERADGEAASRREQDEIARLHPRGREAAIRKAMLQTELWKLDPSASARHIKQLREDIEQIGLQIKLAVRAKSRVDTQLAEKPAAIAAKGKGVNAERKLFEEEAKKKERSKLLGRYISMLEATKDVMQREAYAARRSVLKRSVRARQASLLQSAKRHMAACVIQRVARSRKHVQALNRMFSVIQEETNAQLRAACKAQIDATWGTLIKVLSTAESAKRSAVAATMLQRAARERKWRAQAIVEAEAALTQTDESARASRMSMSAMRFASQRARLLQRERAFQSEHPVTAKKLRPVRSSSSRGQMASPRSKLRRVVETQDEAQARSANIESHAHRVAAAVQQELRGSLAFRAQPPPGQMGLSEGVRTQEQSAGPFAAQRPVSNMSSRGRSRRYSNRTPRPATAPTPRSGMYPTPPPHRPPGIISPRITAPQAETPCSVSEAVAAFALGRHAWVQTQMARDVIESAAAETLRPALDRMAAQAVGSGAKAAVLLARRACENPPSATPQADSIERRHVFANPRLNEPRTATSKIAAMWDDSSFKTAHIKEQRALYNKWRTERRMWLQSSGLRHTILIEEEQRSLTLQRVQQQELFALADRMRVWQREDDAAIRIQMGYLAMRLQRMRRRQMHISLQMRGIHSLSPDAQKEVASNLYARLSPERSKPLPASEPALPTHASSVPEDPSSLPTESAPLGSSTQNVTQHHMPLSLQLKDTLASEGSYSFDVSCTLSELVANITTGIDAAMAPFTDDCIAQESSSAISANACTTRRSTRSARIVGTKAVARRDVILRGVTTSCHAPAA